MAALDGGAKILAVASGSDSEETLISAGADSVIPDLADLTLFRAAFMRVRRA